MSKTYDNRMTDDKTFWDDFIDDDDVEIIDPAKMTHEERNEFIEGIYEDYKVFEKAHDIPQMSNFSKKYGQLLSGLIKKFGH